MKNRSSLGSIFPSMAMARLVVFFAVHPGERFHFRELKRRTELSAASLQNELQRLGGIGAVRRQNEGNRSYYAADETDPAWRAWMLLLRSAAEPADVLREALIDADGIEAAFVFGSAARDEASRGGDVDLLLLGSGEARRAAGRRLIEAELLIGRPLDVVGYEAREFASRARSGNSFARRVMAEPQQWVRGSPGDVELPEAA